MELNQTREDLELLERQNSVSLEDALNLIYDFFREVRQKTGKSLEKEPVEDIDGLFRRLPWLLRTSVKMVETNQDMIFDPDRKEKLRLRREELTGIEDRLAGELDLGVQLAEEEKKLRAKKAELEQARRREAELRKVISSLQEDIRVLEDSNLPELENQAAVLKTQKEKLLDEIHAARVRIEGIRRECEDTELELQQCRSVAAQEQKKTEAVRKSVQDTEDQIRAEKERRAGVEAKLKNEAEEFEKERGLTAVRVREAEDRLAEQKNALENIRADLSTLQAQRNLIEDSIRTTQDQSAKEEEALDEKTAQRAEEERRALELEEKIRVMDEALQDLTEQTTALQSRLGTLEEIHSERQAKRDELDAKVSTFSKVCDRLREEVRLLEKDLERRDFSAQEQRLSSRKEELKSELDRFNAICREVEEQEQELTRTGQDIQAQENRLVEVNQKIVQSETRKNSLIETVQTQENRLHTLETWLEGLEADRYRKRCESLSDRVRTLDEIRKKVEEDWFSDWRRENLDLHDTYEYAADALRRNLSDMETCLRRYIGILKDVIRCMESKSLQK